MATKSWPAQGTIVAIDETNSGTYTVINQVLNFSHAGGGEMHKRNTTVLASVAFTYAPTIPDNGEFTISLLYDPIDVVHIFVRALKDANSLGFNAVKVTYNNTLPSTDVMEAFVTNFDGINGDGVDESLVADVTFQCTGPVVHT